MAATVEEGNMRCFYVRNVSEALYQVKLAIEEEGVKVETRNGTALEFPTPVMTTYTHSRERVLFYSERDANPFFHFMESLWMLAGRNDVEWISQFNGRISTYSDDGEYFHGAYGFRWREWFGEDQLKTAIHRLKTYPNDRRTVVGMWDPWEDLQTYNDGKDYPCNTQIYFWSRENKLNMTVVNRSNDMIWGAYGANAVHMSVLLEYMAARCGMKVGTYYQFSNNLHAYVDVLEKMSGILGTPDYDPYACINEDGSHYIPPPIVTDPKSFDEELEQWFESPDTKFTNTWLHEVASPMFYSWQHHKSQEKVEAVLEAALIKDEAWSQACVEWLSRRYDK